jgi:hypothetical protein
MQIRTGVYILVRNGYLFPPPPEIYIFSPKKQRDFRATLPTTKYDKIAEIKDFREKDFSKFRGLLVSRK